MIDKLTDLRGKFFVVEDAAVTDYNLTPYEGWLYIMMLKHANRDTGELFPSVQTLVGETQMSKAQVLRCTKSIEAKGLIRVTRDDKKNGKGRAVNHYFILRATRYLVDTDPGILQTPTPVSTGNLNQNHFEPEKDIAGEPAAQSDSKPKTERPRNPIFDAVALGSFGIANVNGDKTVGALVGKIVKWLKDQPDVTAGRVVQFYGWYARQTQNADAPRDAAKFGSWWLKFTQGAAPALKPEQVGDPQFDLDVPMQFDPFDNFFKPDVQS